MSSGLDWERFGVITGGDKVCILSPPLLSEKDLSISLRKKSNSSFLLQSTAAVSKDIPNTASSLLEPWANEHAPSNTVLRISQHYLCTTCTYWFAAPQQFHTKQDIREMENETIEDNKL